MHYQQVAFDVVGTILGNSTWQKSARVTCCSGVSCYVQVFEKRYTAEEEGSAVYASYKCVPVASCQLCDLPSIQLASINAHITRPHESFLDQSCKCGVIIQVPALED
jgi:hypothetical protein